MRFPRVACFGTNEDGSLSFIGCYGEEIDRNNISAMIKALQDFQLSVTEEEIDWQNRQTRWQAALSRCTHFGKKNNNGIVYLFHSQLTQEYKIGCTSALEQRLACVRSKKKDPSVRLVYAFNSEKMRVTEKALHLLFKEKNTLGEWFRLTDEDVDFIKFIGEQGNGVVSA